MTPRPAPLVVELALHALSFAPAPEPGSLHDARYTAWCRRHLPPGAWRPLDDDAALVASLAARAGSAWWGLQLLPFAHRDVRALVAAAARPVTALDPRDAARPGAVEALWRVAEESEALVEVARADAALVARDYAAAHPTLVAPEVLRAVGDTASSFAAAVALAPSLARCDLWLTSPLGARGRAYGDTLLLGAPAAWNALPAAHPAVVALHERAVTLASRGARGGREGRWAESEGVALRALELLVRKSALEGAWAAWRAGIDAGRVEAVEASDARVARVLASLRAG